jgi:hypothetical protein
LALKGGVTDDQLGEAIRRYYLEDSAKVEGQLVREIGFWKQYIETARLNNARLDVVEEAGKSFQLDGAWHVMSAQAIQQYPGLKALALQVPNVILDDEFGEAIVRLMEEPQPIGRIHFYYVAREELDRFLLFMEMEPPPLVLQEGWLTEHLLAEPYPPFQDFLKEFLSLHLSEVKVTSEDQGIDWNRLANALEILAGA